MGELIIKINKSLPDIAGPVMSNLCEHERSSMAAATEALINAVKRFNYRFLESQDQLYIAKAIYSVGGGHSLELKDIYYAKNSKRKTFMLNVIRHMSMNLFFSDPNDYMDMHVDFLLEELSGNYNELDHLQLEDERTTLDRDTEELKEFISFTRTLISFEEVISSYEALNSKDKKYFKELMELLEEIGDVPISSYSFYDENESEESFLKTFSLEIDFSNVITASSFASLDEQYNNEGISYPSIGGIIGEKIEYKDNFQLYVDLTDLVNKIINERFNRNN
jgi:hypothetical protein